MRIAVLSDIHGNLTALRAVLADLRHTAPDLVLHGGDLADSGSSPTEVLDLVRDLGLPGVLGNTDDMLIHPDSLETFAAHSAAPPALWDAVRQIASATRTALGPDRLAWLHQLPLVHTETHTEAPIALVHATPQSCWHAPGPNATDAELEAIYAPLTQHIAQPIIVYAHTHLPSVRTLPSGRLLINTGSVGLPYDGDPRAAYLLLDDTTPSIRRVPYDIETELNALSSSTLPSASWTARMLRSASPQMP